MSMDKMQLAKEAVRRAKAAGAEYADARLVRLNLEELSVKNGAPGEAGAPEEWGVGVRVRNDGCFGFGARPLVAGSELEAVTEAAQAAVECAGSLKGAMRTPTGWAELSGDQADSYETPVERDPFSVPVAERLELLQEANASMDQHDSVVSRRAHCSLRREEQWQASSEGAALHQLLIRTGAGMDVTAAANGQVQRRSHPSSWGNYKSGGWEHVEAMELPLAGPRLCEEAVALCSADPCPSGERTVVIGASQLALQIHESVGHPNELDRVHGHEVDLAGSSFATTEKLGGFQYGSELVNLVADSTIPGGLDTRGWDDECVPSNRWHVVKDGIFSGYHTSREWAHTVGEAGSKGTARAEGWRNPPIIRITNLSLQPGTWDFDSLIADCEDGSIFMDFVKMWSIDQRRLNFQFTCEVAWEIQGGKLGRMLRNPTYQGRTPDFWGSCDAICGPDHWDLWGVSNCGKGNPMQTAEMSHGAAPARFRELTLVGAE
ncbi:MAG: TldD/PmbA family protein [Planctomycetes bacterium]|nr:TldD/PmbA family protein [Planctomycetota bacterium]